MLSCGKVEIEPKTQPARSPERTRAARVSFQRGRAGTAASLSTAGRTAQPPPGSHFSPETESLHGVTLPALVHRPTWPAAEKLATVGGMNFDPSQATLHRWAAVVMARSRRLVQETKALRRGGVFGRSGTIGWPDHP